MKRILFCLITSPFFCLAQNEPCDSLFKTTVDKFTSVSVTETELIPVENNEQKIALRLTKNDKRITFNTIPMNPSGLGCIDADAKITFLFSDGTKMECVNMYSFNCNTLTGVAFYTKGMGSKPFIERARKLSTTKLKAVRIALSKSYFDYDFTDEQSEWINNAFKCALQLK